MSDLTIERVQVYAVGPETPRYAWAEGMPEQFMTNNMVRLTTRGGLEGVGAACSFSQRGFDRAVAETMRHLVPHLLGATPLEREALWQRMHDLNLPQAPQAHSAIDIALWDLAAKHARLPLYQMLGGARSRILSYASTPLLPDVPSYLDFVEELRRAGFTAVKFHSWCRLDRDLALARAAQERFGGKLTLMLDVEQRYSRRDALAAARELEALGFHWFEAPLVDTDLAGYRALRRRVGIRIIPAGNWVLDPHLIEIGIRMGAWSSVRVDATIAGGITPTLKIMGLAEAAGMTCELQCWGYTLTQAANLHLMLARGNCTYFEQPVPYPAFEAGSLDVIRTDSESYVHAPAGNGLGIRI
ncbi:MAG: mandelate racemase/muconate lactonizing enzyme family protein, partial [Alphaproteobacteria bacterium]|nr:mandelate racemase/muconate lactonizing enzyme family protein [Alphaproteobacteria bacterium]